eukprot:6411249-Karenia_brevis.AAC.1
MKKAGKPRQEMSVLETLHMAHCLVETNWSLMSGQHNEAKEEDFQIVPAFTRDGHPVDYFPVLR